MLKTESSLHQQAAEETEFASGIKKWSAGEPQQDRMCSVSSRRASADVLHQLSAAEVIREVETLEGEV